MSLIYGEKQDGISQAVRIDDAGRLVVIQAEPAHGYDLVIPPWDITFQAAGDDGRTEGWRYITPSTSEVVTDPVYVGTLDDVYVLCIFGPHPTSGTTGRFRVYAPIAAGEDIWGRRQINPEGSNLNTFTLSTASDATVVWFGPKNMHSSNLEFRHVVPPWLQFGVMTSNPQVPVTIAVYGR
jgi:hypothetical protein